MNMFLCCGADLWKGEVEGGRGGSGNDAWSESERDWWMQGKE